MTFQWKLKLRHYALFFFTYFDGKNTALEMHLQIPLEVPQDYNIFSKLPGK